jgi:hypothetical protein
MGVLAPLTLLTNTSLEVGTESGFIINLAGFGCRDLCNLLEKRLQEISIFLFLALRDLRIACLVLHRTHASLNQND